MNSGIYMIQSKLFPERKYIGSTVDLHRRKLEHLKRLVNQKHPNTILQRHYDKYGKEDLVFSTIEKCHEPKLLTREQFHIDAQKPSFNICKTAGRTIGIKQSDETKRKRAEANRLNWANKTEEERKRLSEIYSKARADRTKDLSGRHGYFMLELTSNRTNGRSLVYKRVCILCDSIKMITRETIGSKCSCMKKRSGCDILIKSMPKAPREKGPVEYRSLPTRSASGHKGLTFEKRANRWRVRLKYRGKMLHVGYYDSIEEAVIGRDKYIRENDLPHLT